MFGKKKFREKVAKKWSDVYDALGGGEEAEESDHKVRQEKSVCVHFKWKGPAHWRHTGWQISKKKRRRRRQFCNWASVRLGSVQLANCSPGNWDSTVSKSVRKISPVADNDHSVTWAADCFSDDDGDGDGGDPFDGDVCGGLGGGLSPSSGHLRRSSNDSWWWWQAGRQALVSLVALGITWLCSVARVSTSSWMPLVAWHLTPRLGHTLLPVTSVWASQWGGDTSAAFQQKLVPRQSKKNGAWHHHPIDT